MRGLSYNNLVKFIIESKIKLGTSESETIGTDDLGRIITIVNSDGPLIYFHISHPTKIKDKEIIALGENPEKPLWKTEYTGEHKGELVIVKKKLIESQHHANPEFPYRGNPGITKLEEQWLYDCKFEEEKKGSFKTANGTELLFRQREEVYRGNFKTEFYLA